MPEDEGEYEIVPHKEVLELKRQVDEIKAHPFGSTSEGKDMLSALRRLSDSMDSLTGLFQEAAEQMKLEERESELISQKLDPLFVKMDDLIEQNKKIAKGILAVADMVKDDMSRSRLRDNSSMNQMSQMNPPMMPPSSDYSSMSAPIRVEAPNIMPPGGAAMSGSQRNEFMQGQQSMPRTGGQISPPPTAPPMPLGMPPLPPKTSKRRIFPF